MDASKALRQMQRWPRSAAGQRQVAGARNLQTLTAQCNSAAHFHATPTRKESICLHKMRPNTVASVQRAAKSGKNGQKVEKSDKNGLQMTISSTFLPETVSVHHCLFTTRPTSKRLPRSSASKLRSLLARILTPSSFRRASCARTSSSSPVLTFDVASPVPVAQKGGPKSAAKKQPENGAQCPADWPLQLQMV